MKVVVHNSQIIDNGDQTSTIDVKPGQIVSGTGDGTVPTSGAFDTQPEAEAAAKAADEVPGEQRTFAVYQSASDGKFHFAATNSPELTGVPWLFVTNPKFSPAEADQSQMQVSEVDKPAIEGRKRQRGEG